MGLDDRARNTAQDLGGKAKEAVGDATDNERLEAEGQADQFGAGVKQAGEDVKTPSVDPVAEAPATRSGRAGASPFG